METNSVALHQTIAKYTAFEIYQNRLKGKTVLEMPHKKKIGFDQEGLRQINPCCGVS